MLNDFIASYQAGLTYCCLFMGLLVIAVWVGLTLAPVIRDTLASFRKLSPLKKAVALVAVSVAIVYGAMTPVTPASALPSSAPAFLTGLIPP